MSCFISSSSSSSVAAKLRRSVCPDNVDDEELVLFDVIAVDVIDGDNVDELADVEQSASELFRGVVSSALPPPSLDAKLMRAVYPDKLLSLGLSPAAIPTSTVNGDVELRRDGPWWTADCAAVAAEVKAATAASRSARAALCAFSAASCAIAASTSSIDITCRVGRSRASDGPRSVFSRITNTLTFSFAPPACNTNRYRTIYA